MQGWLKVLLVSVLVFSASSFVWFLLGSTAYFQRGMDIIGTAILVSIGVPVVLIIGLFISQLMKGWTPTNGVAYTGFFSGLILLTLLSTYLIQSVDTNGWLIERIRSDTIKITADEKYEYRIDLINVFQRNSYAQLYLKNLSTGEEKNIPTDIQTKKMVGLGIKDVNHWVILEPADGLHQYTLSTTKELGIPIERFEINVNTGAVKRLE